ncbi:hypothetical protein KXV85_005170, partial [Aspergillus fumigatus]
TAAAAGLAMAALGDVSEFDALTCSLLAALVALGALEHWFMVLPVPVVDLWRWAAGSQPAPVVSVVPELPTKPVLAVIPGGVSIDRPLPVKSAGSLARQRLEDQFRQAYRESKAASAAKLAGAIVDNRISDGR